MEAPALSNLPPLSATALFAENLVGVLLRNVFGFAPILSFFGNQMLAPRHGECPRPEFCTRSPVASHAINVREF